MRDEVRFAAIVSKAVVRYSAESTVYAGSKMVEFLLTLFFTAADPALCECFADAALDELAADQ